MLEYIFFHNRPRKYFIRYLSNNGIRYNEKEDDHMGMVVAIPEDLDELILEEIEHHYDELMEDAEELLAEEEGDTGKQVAAITIDLDDGQTVYATVKPDVLNRILSAISHQELTEFVDSVASSIQNMDSRPLCKR